MAADTIQLVVERERTFEAMINAERERLTLALDTHANELEETHASRIDARTQLYERQLRALERELAEAEQRALDAAHDDASGLDLSDEQVMQFTEQVLNRFSWRPSPVTK